MQSDTCFWQNGRMNPNFQFDRRRRRAMPIVGCGFCEIQPQSQVLAERTQPVPTRMSLLGCPGCPCLDVPAWQTQWRFAPAAALTAAHFGARGAEDPAGNRGSASSRIACSVSSLPLEPVGKPLEHIHGDVVQAVHFINDQQLDPPVEGQRLAPRSSTSSPMRGAPTLKITREVRSPR
jgi:hypothetical protein